MALIPPIYRRRWDHVILACALLLILAGFLAINSATHHPDSPRHGYIWRHLAGFLLGGVALTFFLFLPLRLWEDWAWLIYGVGIFLLLAVLFLGVNEYGARRWFRLGFIRFQPSEFAKLALIATLARYLSGKRVDLARPTHLAAALGLALVPFLLVLKEPDLGTAGAFLGLTLPMLIWAGIPRITLFALLSPLITLALMHHWPVWALFLVLAAAVLWRSRLSWGVVGGFVGAHLLLFFGAQRIMAHLHPYQQARITTFLNPESDPSGAGYQVLQSKIALGSGMLFGKGYLKGTQSALSFLPQQHTDFIYAVVGEEWGFLGCAALVLLFFALCLRILHVARHARSPFASFLAVGTCGLIFYHAALNMAMTMGLFPVTGLPLPFVSYGGSFLIVMMAGLGQLENIAVHRYDY
jgi:rod shape determining protein RodA